MKKVILSENNAKVLLEYAGYVNIWNRLIPIISEQFKERCLIHAKENGLDVSGDIDSLYDIYKSMVDNNQITSVMQPFSIYSDDIKEYVPLKFCNLKRIIIMPTYKTSGGSFRPSQMSYNEETKTFNLIVICLSPLLAFSKENKVLKNVLQHELTHAYEFMNKVVKKGYDYAINNMNNRYYAGINHNNIVDELSYILSKVEINAMISELWQFFLSHKTEDWFLTTEFKRSTIGKKMERIEVLKYWFENDIKYTKEVMKFLEDNPEHSDMFPKTRNNNVSSMQKRIVRALDFKLKYIKNKVNRLINRYKKELLQGNLGYENKSIEEF